MKRFNKITRALRTLFGTQTGIFWLFISSLLVPNALLIITEKYPPLTAAASLILPAGVYMLFMSLFKRVGISIFIALPLIVLCAFQLVIMYLFGGSIIAVDMFTNLLTTNASEAGELLGSIMPAIIGVCVIYIPMLVLAALSLKRIDAMTTQSRRRKLKYGAIITAIGVVVALVASWTNSGFGVKYHIFPANVIYNIKLTSDQWQKSLHYPETSAGFKFESVRAKSIEEPEVYILVVGEASRACSWSMFGYNRPTTTALDTLSGVIPFKRVFTQNNATHKSVPLILSSVDADNFNDIYYQKSLITAFAEAGFNTLYISNQVPNRSMIDYFGDEADNRINLRMGDGMTKINRPDGDMLPYIKKAVDENRGKLLIVLHTYGSHFNFQERYPAEAAIFKPDAITSVDMANRPIIINAYDNAIAYTAGFLKNITDILKESKQSAALLYCSDHGEDILDDSRERFLHASPTTTYYQLHVASFMWHSDKYADIFPEKIAAAQANSDSTAMTSMVFHTILDIAGISDRGNKYIKQNTSMVSNQFVVKPLIYLNDHYQRINLSKSDTEPTVE